MRKRPQSPQALPDQRHTQAKNSQVSAPSKRRTPTDSRSWGSKFLKFTPCRAPGSGFNGSQWVVQPQVAQRTVLKVRSPWMYSCVCSGYPLIFTVPKCQAPSDHEPAWAINPASRCADFADSELAFNGPKRGQTQQQCIPPCFPNAQRSPHLATTANPPQAVKSNTNTSACSPRANTNRVSPIKPMASPACSC